MTVFPTPSDRISTCDLLLKRQKTTLFLENLITGDEWSLPLVQLLLEKGVDPKEADLDGRDSLRLCLSKQTEWTHPHRSTTVKEMEKWVLVWILKKMTEIDGTTG